MATFNKFNFFVQDVANSTHNLGTNQLTVALTDVAPVATNLHRYVAQRTLCNS